jgi:hypothetical protein
MWPSERAASTVFDLANLALVVSLAVGAASTVLVVWMGGVKESYLKLDVAAASAVGDTAKRDAAQAHAAAASANERAESIHQANLETQSRLVATERQLEAERTERLRLEASVAPRMLSDEQAAVLITKLKKIPRPVTVFLTFLGDEEANRYAQMIDGALNAAQVQRRTSGVGMIAPPPYGLQITLGADNPKAGAIRAAFEAAHIPASFSVGSTGEFDARILVGLRPLGPNH